MKKQETILIGGVAALIGIGVIAALTLRQNDQGPVAKNEDERRVEILKERNTAPLDKETRENINRLIQEIGRETGMVYVNGTKVSVSTAGVWELRKIEKAAIPALIDAVTNGRNALTRQAAMGTIYNIYDDVGGRPMELLPLFVLAMGDKEAGVRGVAVAKIGRLGFELKLAGREEELEKVLPYLRKALSDKGDKVEFLAAKSIVIHRLCR